VVLCSESRSTKERSAVNLSLEKTATERSQVQKLMAGCGPYADIPAEGVGTIAQPGEPFPK